MRIEKLRKLPVPQVNDSARPQNKTMWRSLIGSKMMGENPPAKKRPCELRAPVTIAAQQINAT